MGGGRGEGAGLFGEERGEVFCEEHWAEGVDAEGFESEGGGDLLGAFFGVEDAGEEEGEV